MNFSFLKDKIVQFYIDVGFIVIMTTWFGGWGYWNLTKLWTKMTNTSFATILVALVVFEFLFEFLFVSWRVSVKASNFVPAIVENKVMPLTKEQVDFNEVQNKMSEMFGGEKMEEETNKEESTIQEPEVEKEQVQEIQPVQPVVDMAKFVEGAKKNPTKGYGDFVKEEAERVRKIDEEKKKADEIQKKLSPKDKEDLKNALKAHWIQQLKDGTVKVVPNEQTLQDMGVASWEPVEPNSKTEPSKGSKQKGKDSESVDLTR